MKLLNRFLDLLYPPRCALCDEVVPAGTLACPGCLDAFLAFDRLGLALCPKCGKPLDSCRCNVTSRSFARCVSVAPYEGGMITAIRKLKEYPKDNAVAFLGGEMVKLARREYKGVAFDWVTEVPMASGKKKERGHNQAESLALILADRLGIAHLTGVLARSELAQTQHELGAREREKNAKSGYFLLPGAEANGTVLLVDDVMTTGATLDACARLLYDCGAREVYCATAASTIKK